MQQNVFEWITHCVIFLHRDQCYDEDRHPVRDMLQKIHNRAARKSHVLLITRNRAYKVLEESVPNGQKEKRDIGYSEVGQIHVGDGSHGTNSRHHEQESKITEEPCRENEWHDNYPHRQGGFVVKEVRSSKRILRIVESVTRITKWFVLHGAFQPSAPLSVLSRSSPECMIRSIMLSKLPLGKMTPICYSLTQ